MENGSGAERYWAATRIRTRAMRMEFHAVVGRDATNSDFVVRLRYAGRYAHWYYFYDSFDDALVRAACYDGMTNAAGDHLQQSALAFARAYVNE